MATMQTTRKHILAALAAAGQDQDPRFLRFEQKPDGSREAHAMIGIDLAELPTRRWAGLYISVRDEQVRYRLVTALVAIRTVTRRTITTRSGRVLAGPDQIIYSYPEFATVPEALAAFAQALRAERRV